MKTLATVLRRILAVFLALACLLLTVAAAVAIPMANNYSAMISMALGQKTTSVKGGGDPQYYTSDYASEEQMVQAAALLCRQVEEEGMVLLKNDQAALPLAEGAKVSLLSQNSVDLVYGGAGAGSVDASKALNLRQALEQAGFAVNPTLWEFYTEGAGAAYRKQVPNLFGAGSFAAAEVPLEVYPQQVLDSLQQYNDAAIVVIGRSGSESVDLPADYLHFTEDERALLEMARAQFGKVILLLNVTNAMDLSVLDACDVDACLWVGALGETGVEAIGEALKGSVNPSGRTADTWAYDPLSAPAMQNLGDYTIANSAVEAGEKYLVYAEGVYVGYRYYETRYEDAVLGQGNAGSFDYGTTVQFPFGYGLSYTEFDWSGYTVAETADAFAVSVTVKNTGAAAGKEVVQVYLQRPYTDYDRQNGIEKPAVELAGFAKTETLAPGESQTVTVQVEKEQLKTYDAAGAGSYILEAGDYYLTAAANAHAAVNQILAAKGAAVDGDAALAACYTVEQTDTQRYAVSAVTGQKIENRLADADIRSYDGSFAYLTRSDWAGSWPATYQNGSWEAPETVLAGLEIRSTEDPAAQSPAFDQEGDLALADLVGQAFDDPRWEALLSQMSAEETYDLIRHAGYGTMAVESITAPGTVQKDGPAGISSTLAGGNLSCMAYPPAVVLASSWNEALAEARGRMVGEDSIATGVSVWYAPAMNIHRAAVCGRNFEYYSEDGYLSGAIGAAEVRGAQSKGCIVTIKHFALNDQETNRVGGAVFASEQAARELYLKPFEMSVVEGGAWGIMSSMNRLGTCWSGGHKGLMTDILRGEWGYEGFVITDQASFSACNYCDIREGLAAGNDLWLNTAYNMWDLSEEQLTPSVLANARTAAHRFLYVVANSNAMNGVGSDSTVKNVLAPWQWLILPVVLVIVLLDVGCLFAFCALWASKKYLAKKAAKKQAKGGPNASPSL